MALRMGRCPRCNGAVTLETEGVIATPGTINGVPGMLRRPARFYGCNECEWCEEVIKGRW